MERKKWKAAAPTDCKDLVPHYMASFVKIKLKTNDDSRRSQLESKAANDMNIRYRSSLHPCETNGYNRMGPFEQHCPKTTPTVWFHRNDLMHVVENTVKLILIVVTDTDNSWWTPRHRKHEIENGRWMDLAPYEKKIVSKKR
jgi:hypothetical protein